MPDVTGETFGRYRLVERIGYGGMAEVFRASYAPAPGFDKTLVVKRILPHLSEDERFVNMFQDEASITVHLSHPNVVSVFDFGRIDGIYFLAMEYVHGRNLRQLLKRLREDDRPVPVGLAAYITAETARGLAYAHQATDQLGRHLGIIHRDLNPPNILLSYQGDVKITDFGIAKAARRLEKTEAGRIKGKIEYTAPETLLGKETDHRADLWALGCLLYEMLAGQHPFPVQSDDALAQKIIKITQEKYTPVSELREGVPAPLERAVDLLLHKDPSRRPETAAEIATVASAVVPPTARPRLGDMMRDMFGEEHATEQTPSSSIPSKREYSLPSEIRDAPLEPVSQPSRPYSLNDGEDVEEAIATALNSVGAAQTTSAAGLLSEAEVPDAAPPPRPLVGTEDATVAGQEDRSRPTLDPALNPIGEPERYTPPPSQARPSQPSRSIPQDSPRPVTPSQRERSPADRPPHRDDSKAGSGGLIAALIIVPVLILGAAAGWYFTVGPGGSAQATPTQIVQVSPSPPPATERPSPTAQKKASPTQPTSKPNKTRTPVPVTRLAAVKITAPVQGATLTVNGAKAALPFTEQMAVGKKVKVMITAPGHRSWSSSFVVGEDGNSLSAVMPKLGRGTLAITSQPWAEVIVDGKRLRRQTPIYDLVLSEGRHKISLVNNVENLRFDMTVNIVAGKTTSKSVDLRNRTVN